MNCDVVERAFVYPTFEIANFLQVLTILTHSFCVCVDTFIDFREKGRKREREKHRNIDVRDKHGSAASCTHQTRNIGMCLDQESNQQIFGMR